MRKYKIPDRLSYEILAVLHTGDTYISCGGIPCFDCVLSVYDEVALDDYRCTVGERASPPKVILDRLVSYKIISKVEAMDLMLEGNIK